MTLVAGMGLGVLLVLIFWTLGIIGCVALSRTSGPLKNAVVGIFFLLVLLTLILIFWPRKTVEEELAGSTAKKIEVDGLIIPKTVLFVFICIFAAVAFVFLVQHWMEPVYSPALTSRKTYAF
ncbi:transmembrane protein 218-like [Orbicella faveolata]|uniref:transmembrane protein 218-like n=1 Tax=Orbicella faveolata TaxID=48498 RepID=UPI0009E6191B|nr:transmembrane protein 218-like [Orbicella faveolata]